MMLWEKGVTDFFFLPYPVCVSILFITHKHKSFKKTYLKSQSAWLIKNKQYEMFIHQKRSFKGIPLSHSKFYSMAITFTSIASWISRFSLLCFPFTTRTLQ